MTKRREGWDGDGDHGEGSEKESEAQQSKETVGL